MILGAPPRNDPRSGLLHMSGGRLFQSLAMKIFIKKKILPRLACWMEILIDRSTEGSTGKHRTIIRNSHGVAYRNLQEKFR